MKSLGQIAYESMHHSSGWARAHKEDWEMIAKSVRAAVIGNLLAEVNEQALDDGLWFKAETAPEAYLQSELRRLHMAIEELK